MVLSICGNTAAIIADSHRCPLLVAAKTNMYLPFAVVGYGLHGIFYEIVENAQKLIFVGKDKTRRKGQVLRNERVFFFAKQQKYGFDELTQVDGFVIWGGHLRKRRKFGGNGG